MLSWRPAWFFATCLGRNTTEAGGSPHGVRACTEAGAGFQSTFFFFFRCSDGWRWGQWCWVSAEVVLPALLLTPWADSGLMGLLASYLSSAAGFEGCSMVPSIYPLETLHNSLSLKQVSEFLTSVCQNAGDPHTRTTRGKTHKPTHSCLYL